jgi:hypothetical protein
MKLKLSQPSKLNSQAFPLPVNDEVCKGRIDQNTGELLKKCQKCYADNRGFYAMPDTIKLREDNLAIIKDNIEVFIFFMIGKLNRKRNKDFRWFDSGDILSVEFLKALIEVCKKTPDTRHWIPTTTWNYNNSEFLELLQVLQALPNVILRASNPGAIPVLPKGLYPLQSVVVDKIKKSTKELFYCPASQLNGKCGPCKACYNKNIETVAYLEH